MANLPQELVYEILLRLPVKFLLRFKCVSKSFCAIIESQSFVNSHYERCSENTIHHKLIDLLLDSTDKNNRKIRALEFSDDFQKQTLLFEKPTASNIFRDCLFSYCNGLVLLYIDKLSIWNPSTRKYRILPDLPGDQYTYRPISFGLGYDSTADDYKAVVITWKEEDDTAAQVWIFELRSSSWRRSQDFHYIDNNYFEECGNGDCFVDGALHFICRGRDEYEDEFHIIVAFDVAKETFSVVHEPVYPHILNYRDLNVLGGCLAFCDWNHNMGQVDIYVRKKEGFSFTWTKLYSITTKQFPKEAYDLSVSCGDLAYSKGGDKVFVSTYCKFYSYDLKEKTLQEIVMYTDFNFPRHIFSYTESLVSVGSLDKE